MKSGSDVLNEHNLFDMHSVVLEGRRKLLEYDGMAEDMLSEADHCT